MFRKRNFSIINSPSPNVIVDSPCKIQLTNGTCDLPEIQSAPIPVAVSTPPPAKKSKLSIDEKENLLIEISKLKGEIERKFAALKDVKEKTVELKAKRRALDDYMEIAARGQYEVRNLLNEIFNPGSELATRAAHLIDEAKRRHQHKLEKLVFEMTNILETSQEAIVKKMKLFDHEIELNQRTLLTIECQKRQKLSQTVDDDCIIIESQAKPATPTPAVTPNRATTPNPAATPSAAETQTQSQSTTQDSSATETAATPTREEEIERSFTPCQAQRPEQN